MWHRDVPAVSALDDQTRFRLYRFIRDADRPVSREEAAIGVGISRKLAAFHLEKLVAAGLLEVPLKVESRSHTPGRAPKVYSTAQREFSVTIPVRRYELLGDILLEAMADSSEVDRSAQGAAIAAARRGRATGEKIREEKVLGRVGPERALSAVEEFLAEAGFEPDRPDPQTIVMRNCPFRTLAQRWPELVCEINYAYLDSLAGGIGSDRVRAVRRPPNGTCCVALQAS